VPSKRGRPRAIGADERILDHALTLLTRDGYNGLTLDRLATAAGVAKTTILRRWPSKAAVAAAAVERLALQTVEVPDSGNLRDDLHALIQSAVDVFVRGQGRFVPRLLRESGHHPEIADLLYTVIHTRRLAYRRVLGRAVARHDLHPETDQDLMIDFLIGPIWTRLLITRDPVTDDLVDAIVDFVMSGRPPGAPTPLPRDHVDGGVRGITVSTP
jgi:AcrR family transcriptional regulator